MKKLYTVVIILTFCFLTACGAGQELDRVDTQILDGTGFSLTLPTAWQQEQPASDYGVYAFSADDGQLSLEIVQELGAMEYYSAEELGASVSEAIGGSLFAGEPDSSSSSSDTSYTNVLQGSDADGNKLVCRIDLLMPYPSVRYYLVCTATPDAYKANRRLIEGVRDSFTVTMSAEEMYQFIDEQRRRAAEEAASGVKDK